MRKDEFKSIDDFDFNKLRDHLKKLEKHFNISAHKRNAIVVIGHTGSGKSTIVNYMTDIDLEKGVKTLEGFNLKISSGQENRDTAKIGDTDESETLYPQLYTGLSRELTYCDCPGFEDNRNNEEKICADIGTRIAVKSLNVKALIVVISRAEFTAGRGGYFRKILDLLSKFLDDPQKSVGSILFLVSKCPSKDRDLVLKTIESQMQLAKKTIEEIDERSERNSDRIIEATAKFQILEMMNKYKENIIAAGPKDLEKNTKEEKYSLKWTINQQIQKMLGIPEQQFKLAHKDQTRIRFDQFIHKVIGIIEKDLIYLTKEASQIIKLQRQEFEEQENRLNYNKKLLQRLEAGDKIEEDKEWIQDREARIENANKKIGEIETEILKSHEETTKLQKKIDALNRDDTRIIAWRGEVNPTANVQAFEHDIPNHPPILHIEIKQPQCGKITNSGTNLENGIVRYKYQSDNIAYWITTGKNIIKALVEKNFPSEITPTVEGSIEVFIAKKHAFETGVEIDALKAEIIADEHIIDVNQERIKNYRDEITRLKESVTQKSEDLKVKIASIIELCERNKEIIQRDINKLENEKSKCEDNISKEEDIYNFILKIQPIIYEDDTLVENFVHLYLQYIQYKEEELFSLKHLSQPVFSSSHSSSSTVSSPSSSSTAFSPYRFMPASPQRNIGNYSPLPTSPTKTLLRLSMLTAHRDDLVKKMQNGRQHSSLEKDLENTLNQISEIENSLKEHKEDKLKASSQKWTASTSSSSSSSSPSLASTLPQSNYYRR